MGGSWSNHHFTPLLLIIVLIPRFMIFYLSFIPSSYSLNSFIPACFPVANDLIWFSSFSADLLVKVLLTVYSLLLKRSIINHFFLLHVQIGVWYSNNTLAMNSTSLDINTSETLANKTLVVTTILVRTSPGMTPWAVWVWQHMGGAFKGLLEMLPSLVQVFLIQILHMNRLDLLRASL